jgi:thioredoxin reductase
MQSWLNNMPKGMWLKSMGFASSLYDPGHTFTLRHFCEKEGIPYQDIGLPVRLETFCSYGLAFQERLVSDLQNEKLVALDRYPEGFELQMESGKSIKTRKVVLAVGINYFPHVPKPLAHLPKELCSHSGEHRDLEKFCGRDVVVIGGGASAIDIAVLLREISANVQLITRRPTLEFVQKEEPLRLFLERLRAPMSGIGPGWKSRLCTDAPWVFRYFPDHIRLRATTPPAGGWFMKDAVASLPVLPGYELHEARACGSRVQLRLTAADGSKRHVSADHVIAATGYKADVRRLPFLSSDIVGQLKLIGQSPRLSAHFESSVPGLYFVGNLSSTSFGPVTRFAVGADFTCRRILRHLTWPESVSAATARARKRAAAWRS